jgi:hypothetical protein
MNVMDKLFKWSQGFGYESIFSMFHNIEDAIHFNIETQVVDH